MITTSFSNLRGSVRQSAFARRKKTKVLLTRLANEQSSTSNNTDGQENEEWTYEGHHSTGNQLFRQNQRLRSFVYTMVNSKYYVLLGSLLSLINTIFMIIYSSKLQKDYLIILGKNIT